MKPTIKNLLNVLKANKIKAIEFNNVISWRNYGGCTDILKYLYIKPNSNTIRVIFESDYEYEYNWPLQYLNDSNNNKKRIIEYIFNNIDKIKQSSIEPNLLDNKLKSTYM